MLTALLSCAVSGFLFFILHVTGTGSFPRPLTPAEERDCLDRLRLGDPTARSKLVEHNLRLVAHIIKKYYAANSDQDDLISIGTIGLIKAVNTFDPDKNIKLSSYAARCIENEILMHFRAGRKNAQDISMNEPIESDKDGNALTLSDVLASEDNICDNLEAKIRAEHLYAFLKSALSPRERQVVELRYGLCNRLPLTQREVADRLDISRSYVSRRA